MDEPTFKMSEVDHFEVEATVSWFPTEPEHGMTTEVIDREKVDRVLERMKGLFGWAQINYSVYARVPAPTPGPTFLETRWVCDCGTEEDASVVMMALELYRQTVLDHKREGGGTYHG